jgi:hypothetical protein
MTFSEMAMPKASVKSAVNSKEKKLRATKKNTADGYGRLSSDVSSDENVAVEMVRVAWIGNARVRDMLWQAVDNSSLAHAYGFFGPAHVGKTRLAREMAAKLVGVSDERDIDSHPDVLFFDAAAESVTVAAVRALIGKLSESSFLGGRRVAVIANADALSRDSANTLLKTLEEPRGQVHCILTSSRPEEMLPTVMSRLAKVHFSAVSESEISSGLLGYVDATVLAAVRRFSAGAPGRAIALASDAVLRERVLGDAEFWKNIAQRTVAERFVAFDGVIGSLKVFGELQDRVSELLDVGEIVMGELDVRERAVRVGDVLRARKMLQSNSSPRAAMEWLLAG